MKFIKIYNFLYIKKIFNSYEEKNIKKSSIVNILKYSVIIPKKCSEKNKLMKLFFFLKFPYF